MSEKRPLNGFFVCIYYLVNLVAGILHPVTIIGRENLPEHGALLCPNHNSNWVKSCAINKNGFKSKLLQFCYFYSIISNTKI